MMIHWNEIGHINETIKNRMHHIRSVPFRNHIFNLIRAIF